MADVASGHEMFEMSDFQFQTVYNITSFTFASMMASTLYFWLNLGRVHEKYRNALIITGLVTFIAAYHYFRIFDSWVAAYGYPAAGAHKGDGQPVGEPTLTGVPFNDAYRYMDWLLTVPLLLIEIVLVMNLSPAEATAKSWTLGSAAALMIILGYPGELYMSKETLNLRLIYWVLAMIPFLYIVKELLFGMGDATNSEKDAQTRNAIRYAQIWTCISWCTYPIVYIIPLLGVGGSNAVMGIQVGYCISDIIAKCGVGFLICATTIRKSELLKAQEGLNAPLTANMG